MPDDDIVEASDDLISDSDNETGNEEPVYGPSEIDLNRVPECLDKTLNLSDKQAVLANVNRILTSHGEGTGQLKDPDAIAHMGALVSEFKYASTWTGIVVANP